MMATHLVRRNFVVYWRAWRSSFFLSTLGPLMFLSAMGFGLGSLVTENESFSGIEYLPFFGTGILAASAFQSGVFEGTYPIMAKIVWQRNYEAILATPLQVSDVFLGELMWFAVLQTQMAVSFFAVMALFGIFDSVAAVAAIPVVVLIGISAAAPIMAFTATQETDGAFTPLFRMVVTPLFLLSGTFFPISELPTWGQVIAHLTPLFHGVELVRQLTVYELEPSAVWHLAYLAGLLAAGTLWGMRTFKARLQP